MKPFLPYFHWVLRRFFYFLPVHLAAYTIPFKNSRFSEIYGGGFAFLVVRFEPGTAGFEVQTLPLCHAVATIGFKDNLICMFWSYLAISSSQCYLTIFGENSKNLNSPNLKILCNGSCLYSLKYVVRISDPGLAIGSQIPDGQTRC